MLSVVAVDELGLYDKNYYNPLHAYFYFTISDEQHNRSLHDYEIIGETYPYYWNIDEADMLGNFHQNIADHTTIDEGMTTAASDHPPPLSAQPTRFLDPSEIDIHYPPANVVGAIKTYVENQTTLKPAYRKTPMPTRKLMSITGSVQREVDTELMYNHIPLYTSQPESNERRGNETHTHIAGTNSQILPVDTDSISASEDKDAPTLVETKEYHASSPPEYCNMDMEDAESVYEVYTV